MQNLTAALRITNRLKRFGRDDTGSVVAEAVIVLPVFLWAYIALFVYWDAFRSMNTVQKASFTLSDMISREKQGINSAYVEGMGDLAEHLIDANQNARVRISSVTWSDTNARFEVYWSASPDNARVPLTTGTLQSYAYQIPTMSAGDNAIIVEMDVDYQPTFDIGMPDQTFSQFIVTRPRFIPCITLDTVPCPAS